MKNLLVSGSCVLCCAIAVPARAAAAEAQELAYAASDVQDLADLTIEQLAQIPVRSASKREEPLAEAPAALYVLTGEAIVSSGVTSLPEALRLAPNLHVQQVNASEYSISARGFNGIQAGNKLLALIDGRSIYTPLASSIFWNLHSPLLEDIDQIEVISGPGGTLYGPNAVNGVVSITSRDAQETIGTLARGTLGALERTAALRHGFAIGGSGAMRIHANWYDREGLPAGTGAEVDDDYRGWHAGFRSDFVTDEDHITVQGGIFDTDADTFEGDGAKGHNLLARWSRTLSPTSSFRLQTYYDWFEREFSLVTDSVQTIDAEAEVNVTSRAHTLVAGAGVRTTRDEFINNLNPFNLSDPSRRLWVYNLFVQDRIALAASLDLIAGIKVERSTYTGWQFLPNLRLAWQPNERNLLWAAVSRAVRTPSRIDRELQALPILAPSPGFDSEKLVAVEAGYRGQPSRDVTLSVSGFVNFYDDLRTTELTNGGLPIRLLNGNQGTTYGIEAWATAQVTPRWRLWLGASTLWKDIETEEDRLDLGPRNSLGNDPSYKLSARSLFELAPTVQLTLHARAVDALERDPEIDSYVEAGGQLAWQATDILELFVAGNNLLHKTHAENNDPSQGQLAKRSVHGGARVRF
jgi:iron complex outermembrane receptor protein